MTKGEIKYDNAPSGGPLRVAMPQNDHFRAFRASSGTQPLESCRLSAPVFDRHVNASERIDTCPLPASDWLQKGKGGWMQFYMSSLPYFISPFVKRPQNLLKTRSSRRLKHPLFYALYLFSPCSKPCTRRPDNLKAFPLQFRFGSFRTHELRVVSRRKEHAPSGLGAAQAEGYAFGYRIA